MKKVQKNKKSLLKRLTAFGLTAIASLGLLTACGSNNNSTAAAKGTEKGEESKAIYRTLDEIKESGTVNIGVFTVWICG